MVMINITRAQTKELHSMLKQFPAVAIVGARQVGKTTLAKEIAKKAGAKAVYYDLEKPSDRNRLADIESVLVRDKLKCIVIDEAQTMPELFTALRPLIDDYRKPGRFILLGSVSPHLVKGISESLAGRIGQMELGCLNMSETDKKKISFKKLWFRGGFPEALLTKSNINWFRWCENYYKNFVERDVNFLANESLSPSIVGKLWAMLSGINGNILNYDMISRSLGISRPTVVKYIDFLEGTFLVSRLEPWFINISKRIVKAPKLYFRDTGILHYLNGISTPDELENHIAVGASWEGFVIEQIRQLKPKNISMYYYRTHNGAEADLVLVKGNRPVSCMEIKLSNTPVISRGFHEVIVDMKTKNNFVITPESKNYLHNDATRVCGINDFVKKYLRKL